LLAVAFQPAKLFKKSFSSARRPIIRSTVNLSFIGVSPASARERFVLYLASSFAHQNCFRKPDFASRLRLAFPAISRNT
jgi:hypothetical protein